MAMTCFLCICLHKRVGTGSGTQVLFFQDPDLEHPSSGLGGRTMKSFATLLFVYNRYCWNEIRSPHPSPSLSTLSLSPTLRPP